MVDALNWVSLAVAWVTAWWSDLARTQGPSECHCNCTCEVNPPICPTVSWWWEVTRSLVLVVLGIGIGAGHLVVVLFKVFKVFLEVITSCLSRPTASTPTPLSVPSIPHSVHPEDSSQRQLALRQLEAVRLRRSLKA